MFGLNSLSFDGIISFRSTGTVALLDPIRPNTKISSTWWYTSIHKIQDRIILLSLSSTLIVDAFFGTEQGYDTKITLRYEKTIRRYNTIVVSSMSTYKSILDSSARNEEYRTQIQLDQHEDTIRFKDNVGYTGVLIDPIIDFNKDTDSSNLRLQRFRSRQVQGYKNTKICY